MYMYVLTNKILDVTIVNQEAWIVHQLWPPSTGKKKGKQMGKKRANVREQVFFFHFFF